MFENADNVICNRFNVFQHVTIRQPQNQIALALKHTISNCVAPRILWQAMLVAIEFDHNPPVMLHEVQNVRAKWRLPTKMVTQNTQRSEPPPQLRLGVRCIAPKLPGTFNGKWL